MVFQGRMNRKIYRIVLWVIIILVIISFLMTIVIPLVAATLPLDASPAAAAPSPVEKSLFKALADWLVQPLVSGFLIAVGISGLALELFAMNWGRPGNSRVYLPGTVLFWEQPVGHSGRMGGGSFCVGNCTDRIRGVGLPREIGRRVGWSGPAYRSGCPRQSFDRSGGGIPGGRLSHDSICPAL